MESEERPRGNIPYALYIRYFRAGGNYVVLLLLLVLCVCAQVKRKVLNYSFAIMFYYTTSSVSGQDEPNLAL